MFLRNNTDTGGVDAIVNSNPMEGLQTFSEMAAAESACSGAAPFLAEGTTMPTAAFSRASEASCGPASSWMPRENGTLPARFRGAFTALPGSEIDSVYTCVDTRSESHVVFSARLPSVRIPSQYGVISPTVDPNAAVAAIQLPWGSAGSGKFACVAFQLQQDGDAPMTISTLGSIRSTMQQAADDCASNLYGPSSMSKYASLQAVQSCSTGIEWSDGVDGMQPAVFTNQDGRSQQEIDRAVCIGPQGRAVLERHSLSLESFSVLANGNYVGDKNATVIITTDTAGSSGEYTIHVMERSTHENEGAAVVRWRKHTRAQATLDNAVREAETVLSASDWEQQLDEVNVLVEPAAGSSIECPAPEPEALAALAGLTTTLDSSITEGGWVRAAHEAGTYGLCKYRDTVVLGAAGNQAVGTITGTAWPNPSNPERVAAVLVEADGDGSLGSAGWACLHVDGDARPLTGTLNVSVAALSGVPRGVE